MKNVYVVSFKGGVSGRATVAADGLDEAKREAAAYARMVTSCIPDEYGLDDIVASVEPAGETPLGAAGFGSRPAVQLEPKDGFIRETAKDVLAAMAAPDFSAVAGASASAV